MTVFGAFCVRVLVAVVGIALEAIFALALHPRVNDYVHLLYTVYGTKSCGHERGNKVISLFTEPQDFLQLHRLRIVHLIVMSNTSYVMIPLLILKACKYLEEFREYCVCSRKNNTAATVTICCATLSPIHSTWKSKGLKEHSCTVMQSCV